MYKQVLYYTATESNSIPSLIFVASLETAPIQSSTRERKSCWTLYTAVVVVVVSLSLSRGVCVHPNDPADDFSRR